MRLLFMRHGQAEDAAVDGSDAGRRLTREGRAASDATVRTVLGAGARPHMVVHSPLARAEETAAVAAAILRPPAGAIADERLLPGAAVDDVAGIVADHRGDPIMLIGHNPDLGMIVGLLIGGGQVAMKTAAIACVELPEVEVGAGQLEWLISPALAAGGPGAPRGEDTSG